MSASFSKFRWFLTLLGFSLYFLDIITDTALAVQYFLNGDYLWMTLTVLFILSAMLVTQIFSFSWYLDNKENPLIHPEEISRMPYGGLAVLHLFGLSIFTRYYQLLSQSFSVVWKKNHDPAAKTKDPQRLFHLATELSMLKLFESFLESVPQLLLQLYINMGHHESSVMQYLAITFSFCSVAWGLVDYRRCLGRSKPHLKEIAFGLPTLTYLLYKMFSISSHLLSLLLLLILSAYSAVALPVVWLLATIWTHFQRTNFCPSKGLEFFYRAVVGVVLTCTFFNVKIQDSEGKKTRIPMTVYYLLSSIKNVAVILLVALLKPELQTSAYFLAVSCVICVGTVMGMLCLGLYYCFLCPTSGGDEVDGPNTQDQTTTRMRHFLQD